MATSGPNSPLNQGQIFSPTGVKYVIKVAPCSAIAFLIFFYVYTMHLIFKACTKRAKLHVCVQKLNKAILK